METNKLRSEIIRDSARIFDLNILTSLQKGSPSYCETYLAERIVHMQKKQNIALETSRHIENLRGMQAVLQDCVNGKRLTSRGQKKRFIDLICHPNHGIPVYVVKRQYVLLKSHDVNLDLFFKDFFSDEENQAHSSLSNDEIDYMIDSLDTAWDKKVMKVVLGTGHCKKQNSELGIGLRVSKYRRQVLSTIEAKKELRLKAKAVVLEDLTTRIGKIEKNISCQKNKLEIKSKIWSQSKLDELAEQIDDLEERKKTYEKYVHEKDNSKSFAEMVSRK
ncbi:Hypothetical predicted protein [Paramuricea clavata]|uniref:Uncharacterized protein n=1 Tax=Paramuricea clavata TaxID=317549 RepID=A0A6S7K0R6_PARCT|nr:Hypothetical predicted protein [Paramuricea clavata]